VIKVSQAAITQPKTIHRNTMNETILTQELEAEQKTFDDGRWDGVIGDTPKYPEDRDYWQGWVLGQREYWMKKLNRSLTMKM
jgi:hypothetical protein